MSNCFNCNQVSYGSSFFGMYWPFSCYTSSTEAPSSTFQPTEILAAPSSIVSMDEFKKAKSQLEKLQHLPNVDNPLIQLIYLTNVKKNNSKSAYTEAQCENFKISGLSDRRSTLWLRAGILMGGVGSIIQGFSFFPSYGEWVSEEGWHEGIPPFLMTLGFFLTIISYVSTGSNPHFASNAANVRQDQRREKIFDAYQKISSRLITLTKERPDLAKKIAKSLSIKAIEKKMMKDDPLAQDCQVLTASLREAKLFALGKIQQSSNLFVQQLILNQQQEETNQKLTQEIDNLRKLYIQILDKLNTVQTTKK